MSRTEKFATELFAETSDDDASMALMQERLEPWLKTTADRISLDHKIANKQALKDLLHNLIATRCPILKGISFDPDKWSIPKNYTSWKKARASLKNLSSQLERVLKLLEEVHADDVPWLAYRKELEKVGLTSIDYRSFQRDATRFQEAANAAAKLRGERGNRPAHPGNLAAAQLCRDFWREYKGQEAKSYFLKSVPRNEFTIWFCAVMKAVDGLTETECKTALKTL